jgi:glycosyltransferase involved in cell wall biosynthesis
MVAPSDVHNAGRVMKIIAYLTSAYARASDSFIRAEVLQLRAAGHTVHTFSIQKPGSEELVSDEIRAEHTRTDYILSHGIPKLFIAAILELTRSPKVALSALLLSFKCRWKGLKGTLWPAAYWMEACYLARQLRLKNVQHLHNHIGHGSAVVAMTASHMSGVPYSLTIHGPSEFFKPEELALHEKIRRSQFTAVISDYGRRELSRWVYREDYSKIHIVRCGVKLNKTQLTPPVSDRRLVCVGRLSEVKGHHVLIDAVARLKDLPKFEVQIIGDGPLRAELQSQIKSLGVGERVQLLGWLPEARVYDAIAASRAMVLSSFAEGLPVVIMEALAMGRPVVATAIAGIPELVQPGVCGWLVPPGSVDDLAASMREALSADQSRLSAMGQSGRELVSRLHDQTREIQKLERLISAN